MKNRITKSNQQLYLLLFFATGTLFICSMGPGLFGGSQALNSWQYKIFHLVCHQDAFRSYSLNGAPMAVCARCFGIYAALFIGLILAPLVARFRFFDKKWFKQFLGVSILLNLADVLANALDIYSNTMHSRFILGALFGLSIMFFLADEFFKKITLTEDTYGTTNTA